MEISILRVGSMKFTFLLLELTFKMHKKIEGHCTAMEFNFFKPSLNNYTMRGAQVALFKTDFQHFSMDILKKIFKVVLLQYLSDKTQKLNIFT